MRPPTACVACRNRRRKCDVNTAGSPCVYCESRHIPCSLTSKHQHCENWSPPGAASSIDGDSSIYQNGTTDIPSPSLTVKLVELYFQYIHDTFHSLFHRPSLLGAVIDGTVPEVILFAIFSLSARFSDDPFFADVDPRDRGRSWAQRAQRLLDLREISLTTVQASVLIGAFVITEGEAGPEAVYYGIACRVAMLLDLPNMLVASQLEQEVNLRVWWSLTMIDVWSSNGVRLPRALESGNDVPYPMQETLFLNLRTTEPVPPGISTMADNSLTSLLTQMVKLNAILADISTVNAFVAANPIHAFDHNQTVDALTERLDEWYNNVAPELQDTHANMTRFSELGLGPMFEAVYLGYYQFGQLLYYQYLHEDCYDDMLHARYYADKCKAHSIGLCEILYRASSIPGCEVYYTMVGHVLVIASTVQIHTLLFSTEEAQIRNARSRLEKNFEILTKLQSFWPTLDICFIRLREFHKACSKSKETTFRMDRWMLRFLFEFAKPIEEKEDDLADLQTWSLDNLGLCTTVAY